MSLVESPLVAEPDVSSDDFLALSFLPLVSFVSALLTGFASEPAAVGVSPEAPDEASVALDPDVSALPDGVPDALLPADDASVASDEPEVSPLPALLLPLVPLLPLVSLLPLVPETPEEASPERLAPEGRVPLAPGVVSTGPALPEGIALPWSCGIAPEDEVALLTDPGPCAKAAEDTDATMTNERVRRVVFNVIANSLNEKLRIIDAGAWIDDVRACSARCAFTSPPVA